MPLTDIAIRQAKATEKPFKLSDGGGLHLLVTPTGGKLWRLAYRFDGKQRQLAFGGYPEVTLKDSRARRDAAKETLAAGVDPGAKAKIEKRTRQIAAGIRSVSSQRNIELPPPGRWSTRSAPSRRPRHPCSGGRP